MGKVLDRQDTYRGSPWEPSSQNLYVYTRNNPVNWIDPTGHDVCAPGKSDCTAPVSGPGEDIPTWVESAGDIIDNLRHTSRLNSALAAATLFGVATLIKMEGDLHNQANVTTVQGALADVIDTVSNVGDIATSVLPKGGAYTLTDDVGTVVRTGRTSDLAARHVQHDRVYKGEYRFNAAFRTDVYAEQRGLEHMLYEQHRDTAYLNKIKAIDARNPRKAMYIEAARKFLSRLAK